MTCLKNKKLFAFLNAVARSLHFMALPAWAATSRKARDALRRTSLDVVHALEARVLREVLTNYNCVTPLFTNMTVLNSAGLGGHQPEGA